MLDEKYISLLLNILYNKIDSNKEKYELSLYIDNTRSGRIKVKMYDKIREKYLNIKYFDELMDDIEFSSLVNILYTKFDQNKEKYNFKLYKENNRIKAEIYCKVHKCTATSYFDNLLLDIPKYKECCPLCHPFETHNNFTLSTYDDFKNALILKFPELKTYIEKLEFLDDIKEFKLSLRYKINVKCKDHGEFKVSTTEMYRKGRLCPHCARLRLWDKRGRLSNEDVIKNCIKVHDNQYDYSKVKYIGPKDKIEIICHKKDRFGNEHGSFFQTYNKHIQGRGCPKCGINKSKLEEDVEQYLIKNDIKYIPQYRFDFAKTLPLDFYLPSYNLVIECQGRQHFQFDNNFYHQTIEQHNALLERDEMKFQLLKDNEIKVIYYASCEIPEYFNKKHEYFKSIEQIKKYLNNIK